MPMTITRLVQFKTDDNLLLPGLLYEPVKKTKKVLIYLHGNGSSSVFYKPELMNPLAESLSRIGISFFPFNNRGAHVIKRLDKKNKDGTEERVFYGMAYEIIKECVFDIDGAIEYLLTEGYNEFYLVGSSTGANKICVYNWYRPQNKVSKYILLSGGDDTGLYYSSILGEKKFSRACTVSKQMIDYGKGTKLAPEYLVGKMNFISYQSLFDTINPDGDYNVFPYYEVLFKKKISHKELFRELKSIFKPTLVVYGEVDDYCYGKVPEIIELLTNQTRRASNFTYQIISGADHGFRGKEPELIKTISSWLS